MKSDDIPPTVLDLLYAQEHQLLCDETGRALRDVFDANVADRFVIETLRNRVRNHRIAQMFAGPYPQPHLSAGDFVQGLDLKGSRLLIPLQYLNAHSLTLAGSGSGKTIKALFHCLQIAPRTKGCWLFDCRKTEFRKLKRYLQRVGVEVIILPVHHMRINPLQTPVGVTPIEWIPRCADMLVMVLSAPPRASKLLESALHRLFRRMGVRDGTEAHPTLFDLIDEVKHDRGANPPARQAILDSLDPLLASLGPGVLAYRRGWSSHELAQLPINFVLGGTSQTAQNLVLNWLLLSEFTSRVARGVSNPQMDLYVSVDEGQRLLSAANSGHNALIDLWPLVRGTGLGLDISVPTSHGLLPEALSFTATKYLGRCGAAHDYETVGRAMGLSRAQLDWAFHNTRPGRFIAQLGEGEWRKPYVIEIPLLRLAPPDETIDDGTALLDDLSVVRADEFFNQPASTKDTGTAGVLPDGSAPFADERAYRFCKVVIDCPLRPSSVYPKLVRISSKTAVTIRRALVAKGYLREHTVDTAGRGRGTILLEATEAGVEAVDQYAATMGDV